MIIGILAPIRVSEFSRHYICVEKALTLIYYYENEKNFYLGIAQYVPTDILWLISKLCDGRRM